MLALTNGSTQFSYRIYSKERCSALLFLGVSDAALHRGRRSLKNLLRGRAMKYTHFELRDIVIQENKFLRVI